MLLFFLQACSSEVMMLRMARKYDSNTDSIVFANNQPYTKDSYSDAGMGETIDDLLRFCRQMWAMKVDNAEYALLTAIVIFSGQFLKSPSEHTDVTVLISFELLILRNFTSYFLFFKCTRNLSPFKVNFNKESYVKNCIFEKYERYEITTL